MGNVCLFMDVYSTFVRSKFRPISMLICGLWNLFFVYLKMCCVMFRVVFRMTVLAVLLTCIYQSVSGTLHTFISCTGLTRNFERRAQTDFHLIYQYLFITASECHPLLQWHRYDYFIKRQCFKQSIWSDEATGSMRVFIIVEAHSVFLTGNEALDSDNLFPDDGIKTFRDRILKLYPTELLNHRCHHYL